MVTDASSLFDPAALAIVLAGTVLATLARTGLRDARAAIRAALNLASRDFDDADNRASLARTVSAVRRHGLLAADVTAPPDPALASALDALVRSGSTGAMQAAQDAARAQRTSDRTRAALVFEQAGELAPAFGLVGTLFSMTQLAPVAGGDASAATFGAIATAVLSSLYGVLGAHLVCLPLAQAIMRRGERAEAARDVLIEWLCQEISGALPQTRLTLRPAA